VITTKHKLTPTKFSNEDNKATNSAVRILMAVFVLLVVWFIVWLYDWRDEILGIFKNKPSTAPKSTSGSSTAPDGSGGGDKLIFNTIVKEVSAGSDVRYVHTQESPALLWSINHKLGAITNVQVLSPSGEVIYADIQNNIEWYNDPITGRGGWITNTTNITFTDIKSGFAIFT
jgi:hypothetical protein